MLIVFNNIYGCFQPITFIGFLSLCYISKFYTSLNKGLISKISSINLIIQSVAEDKVDDLYSKVPAAYKPRVRIVEKIVRGYISDMESETSKWYSKAPKSDRKTFMIWVHENKYFGIENNYIKYGSDKCPGYRKLNEMGVTDYKKIFEESEEE